MSKLDELRKRAQAHEAPAREGNSGGGIPTIRTEGAVFNFDGADIGESIENAVILATVIENRYYDTGYTPGEVTPPTCFAVGLSEKELKPHENAVSPQSPTCEECEMNAWGSGRGKGKACGNRKSIVLVSAPTREADVTTLQPARLSLPPTSVHYLTEYARVLHEDGGRPLIGTWTEIRIAPHKKHKQEITFVDRGQITDEALFEALLDRGEVAQTVLLNPPQFDQLEAEAGTTSGTPRGGRP